MNYQQTSGSSFRVKDLAYMGIAAALISVCA